MNLELFFTIPLAAAIIYTLARQIILGIYRVFDNLK
jgi:hypothetical protein